MRNAFVRPPLILSRLATCLGLAAVVPAQQFQQVTNFPGPQRWCEGVECADIDRDGDLDVFFAEGDGFNLAGTKRQNVLIVNKLIEIGAWNFADESVARLGTHVSNSKGVCTGDVTGDGWVDALFVNAFFTDPPFLYINQGAASPGFFNLESSTRGLTVAYSSGAGQFGDLDDDGDLDLIVDDAYNNTPASRPHLFFNNGSGVFAENAAFLNAALKAGQMDVQLVDIDNDWDLDFFGDNKFTNTGGNHYLMLNAGNGSFTEQSSLLAVGNGATYESEVGDLDGDNDLDLFFVSLTGFQEGAVRNNLIGLGSLTFTNQSPLTAAVDDNEIALFDYDNDADYDVLVGSLSTHEYLYRNNGAFSFTDVSSSIQSVSDSSLDCTVADLNNDGKYDILTAQGESGTFINKFYRNTGTADTLKPLVVGHINPASAPAVGPVVVHAKIRDQVIDDGINYVKASASYTINTATATSSVSITAGGFVPAVASVPAGTSIRWTNDSGSSQSVKSTSAPYTYDSGNIGVGASSSFTFVTPGSYDYTSVPSGLTGQVVVTGAATSVNATYSGGQIYRFQLNDTAGGQGVQLCYELRFQDWAGNITVTDARCVMLLGGTPGTAFCAGDGSLATACPCANIGSVGHGCANSVNVNGALLSASGVTNPDSVVLAGSGMPASVSAVYLKGDTNDPVGSVFGDGVLCATGTLIRLKTKMNVGGASQFPEVGDLSLSVRGATPPGSGLTGYYQTYYRNSAAAFCTPETFNVSNGVQVTW